MMMMDYGSQYAPSTMSSETLSGSCGSRNSRIRTIRLIRPSNSTLPPPNLSCRHGPSLGFSVRGGREHGTGFFVSNIEHGSEAHRQGLRVGDQIIRVNGFTVDDAVHKELLQLISNHTHLTLKVRSVGMIPVKDRKTDALSWQIITDTSSLRSSPQLLPEKPHDVRINIIVAPRSKLGCGICKGPEWKPGIFVQFTKEGGIAREAGLRPGDQILSCNGLDFGDVAFNEAVNLMKTSRQLELSVRKSAGSELFPGESSGYNSSASSVTGDQSPSWSDSKRLSMVKEETSDLRKWDPDKHYFKPTIINLSANGTTIENNGTEEECQKLAELCQRHETKTVVVEVHRSANDQELKETPLTQKHLQLTKSASSSSFGSLTSSTSTTCSLSSALCQEIQRRNGNKQVENKPSIDEQLQQEKQKKILKGVTTEKYNQHNKLMDEFKIAHRKMFKAPEVPSAQTQDEAKDRIANTNKELSNKLTERLSSLSTQENVQQRLMCNNGNNNQSNNSTPPPPPPPPPMDDKSNYNTLNGTSSKKGKAPPPPVPVKTSTLSYAQVPPCPTPDYDTLSIASTNSSKNHASQTNTLRKQRPVSVTIGEYPSGTIRRQPSKFDFLQNGTENQRQPKEPITNQLQSELERTLNRSNLRKRTESMENLLIKPQSNGSVRISLHNNLAKCLARSTDDLLNLDDFSKALANRVTININATTERKMDGRNGILKNGTAHKPLVQQKSITFGEIPTVINDRSLHVT